MSSAYEMTQTELKIRHVSIRLILTLLHFLFSFGIKYRVDFIAASFVRKGSDVTNLRKLLADNGGQEIQIISKIENQEGLENYQQILAETDAVMVARGDLGMEIPSSKVFLAQKMMIREANLVGKPVITATQVGRSFGNECGRETARSKLMLFFLFVPDA